MDRTRIDIGYVGRKALEHRAPVAGNVLAIATSTSSAATAIPDAWQDQTVTMIADGGDIYVVFGTSSGVTADKTAVSGATRCVLLSAGLPVSILIERWDSLTHFATQALVGTPTLRAWIASR